MNVCLSVESVLCVCVCVENECVEYECVEMKQCVESESACVESERVYV